MRAFSFALHVRQRAIAAEIGDRFNQDPFFAGVRVGVFTGEAGAIDHADLAPCLRETSIWVMTYERMDLMLRRPMRYHDLLASLGAVAIDEIHLLGDGRRGAILEGLIARLQLINPLVQLIALSATLGNGPQLAKWLGGVFHETFERPVPLRWSQCLFSRSDEKLGLAADICARTKAAGGQTILFLQSRARTQTLAAYLRDQGLQAAHHHAGLTRRQRALVEQQYRDRSLDAICATPTLAAGVNLPCRTVVLYDTQRFVHQGQY